MKAANFGIDIPYGKVIMKTILGKAFILFRKSFSYSENVRLGPVHMHTFTCVSKDTYVSKFTYGVM